MEAVWLPCWGFLGRLGNRPEPSQQHLHLHSRESAQLCGENQSNICKTVLGKQQNAQRGASQRPKGPEQANPMLIQCGYSLPCTGHPLHFCFATQ